MRRRRSRITIAALLATMVVAQLAVASIPTGWAATDASGRLRWTACGDSPRQCSALTVPASYDAPSDGRLTVTVARLPATDPSRRVGSLLVNPGGPGLSAVDSLDGLAASLPASITERFDIVAVDPRGVGHSAPVDCGVPLDPVFDHSFSPTTAPQHAALVESLQAVASGCEARDGTRLRQVSTLDSARDLDVLRARLGEERVTYLGFSYGTYLGALYAALFPDRVRAMVLDGAIDPTTDARDSTVMQARGFEQGLDRFLTWCAGNDDCVFARGGDPAHRYDALRARIAARPLEVDAGATGDDGAPRALNDTRFDAAVLAHLYLGRAAWTALATDLAAADAGRGEGLLGAADRFFGREPGGGDDGSVEAFWAVGCLDDPTSGAADLQVDAEAAAPRIGAFVANFSLACAVWPTRTTPAAATPHFDDVAPDALVVGTTGDPATPLVGAERLARVLGDAPLIVARGSRHTAIGSGNSCVDEAVARYLLTPTKANPARRRC